MAPPKVVRADTAPACATAQVSISFDFAGAPQSHCVINGPREFSLLITPEHAQPINPSPWYAFRFTATGSGPVHIHLDYLGAKHRYAPKLASGGAIRELPVILGRDGARASFKLYPGSGLVSAQPIIGADHYGKMLSSLVSTADGRRVVLGHSLDGRTIEAVRLGSPHASKLIVLLGRQHPPEVTGAYAMEPFVTEIASQLQQEPGLARQYQVLVVPLLNPDGAALGYWRTNRGGIDLNRDWGAFSQPETRAVRDWLNLLDPSIRLAAMIDFHSTRQNLFYVQGEEASPAQQRFLKLWLAGKEKTNPGYSFTIERRNANPGSGTAKNWFHQHYAIPAYTYEVSDRADPGPTGATAIALAQSFLSSLEQANAAP